jgi:SAM-dependent methyltransferase
MYRTQIVKNESSESFDWESFFSPGVSAEIIRQMDPVKILARVRMHLKEDKFQLTMVLSRLMRSLLSGIPLKSPRILELGAATGLLTRWLISRYGGSGVLVDSSEASFQAYARMKDNVKQHITYLETSLFELRLEETFDLVCSFGLIEHFVDKKPVLDVHKKFLAANGRIVILVPLDSPLTRAFLDVHPELNLGYRELLTEKELKTLLRDNDLEVGAAAVSRGYCYDFVGAVCRPGK